MVAVYNKKLPHPPGCVLVDRSTPYGNPFVIGRDGTRDEVCDKFDEWLPKQKKLIAQAKRELRGRNLLCHCVPRRCHGITWLKVVNAKT